MARTVSVTEQQTTTTDDLDGAIVDGIESLRQRIVQAIRFRYQTWFLAHNSGLDYNLLIGHMIRPELAAATLSGVIREEGGAEVLALENVHYSLHRPDRIFSYSVLVQTIYGPLEISESLP